MSASSGNGGGAQPVPAGSLKMVQSVKEIVNFSEAEIYAALKDCNMDPNEAVNRLLSQDPFHEVKSKREKKKEGKDTSESRPRGLNQISSRGSKTESAPLPGKSSYKKENVSNSYTNSLSSMHGVSGNDKSGGPASFSSNDVSAENKGSSFWTADSMPPGIQSASGYQSAWADPPGQVSMADIVKVGRSENKAPNAPNLGFPEDHIESGIYSDQHLPTNNEWPSMNSTENPAITNVISEQYIEARDVPAECINRPYESGETEEDIENSGAYNLGYDSLSSRKIPADDSRSASLFKNDLYDNRSSHRHRPHDFDEDETGAQLSSVTRSLQQFNLEKDVRGLPFDGYMPSVRSVFIPDHLRAQNADCSHLSFGSFGHKTSLPVKSRMEEPRNEPVLSPLDHLNNRSSEYYVEDALGNACNGRLFHRTNAIVGNYDPSTPLKQSGNGEFGNQYSYPPSNRGYAFDDAQPLNASFSRPISQMQILGSLSNDEKKQYTNSLPSNFSPANVHITSPESGIQLSQFPKTQSLSSKYGNLLSTINGSASPMSEDLKTGPLPRHPAAHQFSKPTRPYTNTMGYPFLPQNYTYTPSALNRTSLLPQYKNSAPNGNLHQSRYGGPAFGNSPVGPGNYQTNHPSSVGQGFSYDDEGLSSRYKDSNSHLVSLQQQNENSGMWLQGLNSRGGKYYDYGEAGGGFRRGQQQPSQNYGYSNLYLAEGGGVSFDQPRDGLLDRSGGQPKQSKMWQNGY